MNSCFIALVGKNPLPIYISALENCRKVNRIFLIYTSENKENISSKVVAENIREALIKKIGNVEIELIACDKSNISLIEKTIKDIKEIIKSNSIENIILDYTGGTKIMSVLFCNKFKMANCLLTYVSFEGKEIYKHTSLDDFYEEENPTPISDVLRRYDIKTEDVINLHGYKYKEDNKLAFVDKKGNVLVNKKLRDVKFCQDEFRLYIEFEQLVKEANDIKEYFRYKDFGEKLGGTETKIIISVKLDGKNNDELELKVKDTRDNLVNLVNSDGLEINFINEEDSEE